MCKIGCSYQMQVFGPDDAPNVERFIASFRDEFSRTPQAFFKLSDDLLTVRGSRFVTIAYDDEIVAGARGIQHGALSVHLGQCFTVPQHRGRRLIGAGIAKLRDYFDRAHGVVDADLVVRMMGGRADPNVISAYARVGFSEQEIIRQPINPLDPVSRHLLKTADPGGILSVRVMTATGDSLASNRALLRSFGWGGQ